MRWAVAAITSISIGGACTSEPTPAFELFGAVDQQLETGSTIGLWTVTSPHASTFKFGDGQATTIEFDLAFRIDPLPEAIDSDGIGVAMIGMLPGRSTVNEGEVDPSTLRLIGMTTDSAVIFKSPFSTGPAWTTTFPEGFSCGLCVRDPSGPDSFEPADCTFVTIHRIFTDPCVW